MPPADPNEIARLLLCAAYRAWSLSIGSVAPVARQYHGRAREPRVGDMVCEVTCFGRPRAVPGLNPIAPGDYLRSIGRLLSVEDVPYPDSEDDPPVTRRVYTIESLAGEVVAWENARFVALPEDPFDPEPGEDRL